MILDDHEQQLDDDPRCPSCGQVLADDTTTLDPTTLSDEDLHTWAEQDD